jgi:transcriptional regulator with XRE-family HTH domain
MRYNTEYYTPDNFAPKFKKLLDKKYAHLKEHKQRSTFVKDYFNLFHKDIKNSIDQWCAYRQKPSIESLMNICELLDCDIDYFLTEQEDFKKDITSASEVTGLEYETIEILETLKNSKSKDTENYIDKCILFLLDFLLQRINGREILHALFNYLFKNFSKCYTDNPLNISTSVVLKDNSNINTNNIEIFTDEFSEEYFYSKITRSIVKFKEQEKTVTIDTSKCIYHLSDDSYNNKKNALDLINTLCETYDVEKILNSTRKKIEQSQNLETLEEFNKMCSIVNNRDKIQAQLEYEYNKSKKI